MTATALAPALQWKEQEFRQEQYRFTGHQGAYHTGQEVPVALPAPSRVHALRLAWLNERTFQPQTLAEPGCISIQS